MTNGEWIVENGFNFKDNMLGIVSTSGADHRRSFESIAENAMRAYAEWLDEEHALLTGTERDYLSEVIKPFRDEIRCICKKRYTFDYEFIAGYRNFDSKTPRATLFELPEFKTGTMYNGMEKDVEYSLEELGL